MALTSKQSKLPATKSDLNNLKKDLASRMTSKKDLKDLENRLTERVDGLTERVDGLTEKTDKITVELINVKENLKNYVTKDEFNGKTDKILKVVDAVMVKLDNIEHAFVSNLAAHDRFEERIGRLENFVGINQSKIKLANNS